MVEVADSDVLWGSGKSLGLVGQAFKLIISAFSQTIEIHPLPEDRDSRNPD